MHSDSFRFLMYFFLLQCIEYYYCLKIRRGFGIGSLFGFLGRSSFEAGTGTRLSCGGLLSECLFLDGNGLEFVNLFEKDRLVLELVTLCEHVQGVVNVLVDFLGVSQFLQHAAKDSLATHPQDLEGKTGVGSTSALTNTCSCKTKRNTIEGRQMIYANECIVLVERIKNHPTHTQINAS